MGRQPSFLLFALLCVVCGVVPTQTFAQTYLQLNPTTNQTVTAGNTNITLQGSSTAPNSLWYQQFTPFYKGWDLGNNGTSAQGWASGANRYDNCAVGSQGIQHCGSGIFTHYGIGDTAWSYVYGAAFGGMYRASDEGVTWDTLQGFQMPYFSGPIGSGGTTGSSLITVSPMTCSGYCLQPGLGSYFSQGGYLLDTSKVVGTATLSGSGTSMNASYNTLSSGSVSVSTAWGNIAGPANFTGNTTSGNTTVTSVSSSVPLIVGEGVTGSGIPSGTTIATVGFGTITLSKNATATATSVPISIAFQCGGNGNGQSVVSTSCNISLGTSPASPGNFATGSACMVGPFYEQVQITAVATPVAGVQTLTFNTTYAWNNSNLALVMQGGPCGQAAVQNPSWPVASPVVGATSSTQVYVADCIAGSCNHPGLSVGGTALFTNGVTLTRASGTVTLTYVNGGELHSMPAGTSIVVAGFSPSDLNGTFTVLTNTMDETYGKGIATWAQAGSDEPGTGGSISLPYNTATFYPMAVISGQNGGVVGAANLLYNTTPFANGDTVIGAPTAQYQQAGFQLYVGQNTANDDSIASRAVSVVDQGPSHPKFLIGMDNNESSSPNAPPAEEAMFFHGSYGSDLYFAYRPANNGNLLFVNGNEVYGTNPKHYNIFADDPGYGIGGSFGFDPNTGLFDLNGSKICTATNGQCPGSGTLAITSGGTGTATAPNAGNILVAQSASAYAPEALSGDCGLIASGAITCTKTNGTAFGTMATQNASAVAVTGGTIDGTVIGGATPAAGTFTSAEITGTPAELIFNVPTNKTDEKLTYMTASENFGNAHSQFHIAFASDNGATTTPAIAIARNGANPTSITVGVALSAPSIILNAGVLGANVPIVTVGAAAGTGAVIRFTGQNQAGVISITTGMSPLTTGQLASFVFSSTLTVAPYGCSLMAGNAVSAGLATNLYTTSPSLTTGWSIELAGGTLVANTEYVWSYICF